MKVLFMHIGDLHMKNRQGLNYFQIQKIVDSLNIFRRFDKAIVVIAGDIAYSGEADQYRTASYCVGQLIAGIKRHYNYSGHVEVLCVPGNHDVFHNGQCMNSKKLQDIRKINSYEKLLQVELDKQKYFFDFAKKNGCFSYAGAYFRRIIDLNGFVIEANLIDSGLFSIYDEDKGLHFIPQHCINELNVPSGADFVLTIMHHSPDWYIDSQKNMLEATIYGKSSLVFYGHEHYIGNKTVSHENNPPALVQAGGCLCENDDWTNSTYHVGLLDTDTLVYKQYKFVWNTSQRQYEQKESSENVLSKKPSIEKHINMLSKYIDLLCKDVKHDISQDFRDYFVFPRIQAEDQNGTLGREFTTEDEFITELLARKRNLIMGGYNSGKTALLKSLFLRLSKDYVVIFCDIADIRGKRAERIIKNCFIDIYGDNDSDYKRFLQLPKERLILIIDDIDQIKPESLDSFIAQLGDTFEYIIFASNQLLDISLLDRMKVLLKTTDLVYKYRITPFYSDKRYALIEKVVFLKMDDPATVSKTANLLSEAIKAQKRFVSLDPDFIIKYVEYYCNNIGEAFNNDSGVFSKVFEASLINALSKYQTPKLSVDKTFMLLSKIAYYIHFNKAYPISETHILEIINEYNEEYGANVNGVEAINIMINSKVLISDESTEGYCFANKNFLAFFVAREVNNQYNATGDESNLQKILKCSCFGINADILLFISYITDNIRVLRLILHMVNEYTQEWNEFEFGNKMPQFLKSERKHTVCLPPTDARDKEKNAEIEAEKAISNELKIVNIYDYSEDDVDRFVNQIIRACSLLIVVAKCLPNFEHNMPKADKDAFIDVIYRLPNKIFQLWASKADEEVDNLIQFFKEQSQDYYSRQQELTDDDILRALQWAAMSLLLDLYNLSVFYSTKDNTAQYLSNFNYARGDTYSLEHLMMLEKQNAHNQFVSTAIDMAEQKKDQIFSTLLKRIVHHALVYMNALDFRLTQQLQSRFFPTKDTQKKLMMQRIKNSNKENE
jgi:hypothetical protein